MIVYLQAIGCRSFPGAITKKPVDVSLTGFFVMDSYEVKRSYDSSTIFLRSKNIATRLNNEAKPQTNICE